MILFFIALISNSFASEAMRKGSVLNEDSIVFSVQEANELKSRIEQLEIKEEKVFVLESLVQNQELEIETLKSLNDLSDKRIEVLTNINNLYLDELEREQRQNRLSKINNITWFAIGFVASGAAIYIGDKIGDSMEN